jgi:cytochrome d ubiquinol oxidase subunit I
MKIAAIESMWETEPAPAPFTIVGIPNTETHTTDYAVKVPWMLGLITTRSINKEVPGIVDLVARAETRIKLGLIAYEGLEKLKVDRTDATARANLERNSDDLGYALLLKRIRPDILNATPEEITQAAWNTVPAVSPLFWSFRIMVGLGFYFIALFVVAFWLASRRHLDKYRAFLWVALCSLPLPWLAAELGWFVAEVGRQPWVIEGVLPTFLAVSSITAGNVLTTLIGFVVFYTTLAVVDVYLMIKAIRQGPGEAAGSEAVPSLVPAE